MFSNWRYPAFFFFLIGSAETFRQKSIIVHKKILFYGVIFHFISNSRKELQFLSTLFEQRIRVINESREAKKSKKESQKTLRENHSGDD